MAWNEPGDKDPWGGKRSNDQGPPDLDEALKSFQKKINGIFGGGKASGSGSGANGGGFSGASIVFMLVIAAIVYSGFGIYQVNEQERAVVLRFGVYSDTVQPGLHWNPPLIDSVTKVNTRQLRNYRSKGEMLTEDLNIVDVELSIQYSIVSIRDFVLAIRDPESSLKHAADSALRHVVGSSEMNQVLTEGRAEVGIEVKERLQRYLDSYSTGIVVSTVNIEKTAPPREVQAAFNDVNKAREDEERYKNEAESYANGILPEARGQAQRVLEEATAYREQVIAQADGDASRFNALLVEYTKAPQVTRERLYLDALEGVLSSSSKVMVDVEGGNNMLYLPLDKMMQSSVGSTSGGSVGRQSVNDSDKREIANQVLEQLRNEAANRTRR
jgi:membrane protease subunit HflK